MSCWLPITRNNRPQQKESPALTAWTLTPTVIICAINTHAVQLVFPQIIFVNRLILMSFLINVIALCCCWCGSASAYLASERQQVFVNPLSKKFGWSLFILGVVSAFILLLTLHHWLSAILILMVLIMLDWIVLTLAVPYFPNQHKTLITGTVLTMITALIGGFYVVWINLGKNISWFFSQFFIKHEPID